tara:strand:- start:2972 stop:3295 length:324 start_codon:yes stop_codon:yes gene_type:complete
MKVEDKYPNTCKEFDEITSEMFNLFLRKQADYGPTNVGMGAEVVDTDKKVKRSLTGLSVRMNDKIQRMLNLMLNNKEPLNESIEDTLIDIANYAVMSLIVQRKLWGK